MRGTTPSSPHHDHVTLILFGIVRWPKRRHDDYLSCLGPCQGIFAARLSMHKPQFYEVWFHQKMFEQRKGCLESVVLTCLGRRHTQDMLSAHKLIHIIAFRARSVTTYPTTHRVGIFMQTLENTSWLGRSTLFRFRQDLGIIAQDIRDFSSHSPRPWYHCTRHNKRLFSYHPTPRLLSCLR